MSMLQTLKNISKVEDCRHVIEGYTFKIMEECANEYRSDELSVIPAGTMMDANFMGVFGVYGMVEIKGVLHKIKIDITELHKINWGVFDERKF